MPAFDSSTPTVSTKFADIAINVPQVFAEGHTLTANEAAFLSRQVGSVIGNVFGSKARKTVEFNATAEGQAAPRAMPTQADFDTIFANYELGVSNRGSGETIDRILAAARKIAEKPFHDLLKAKKIKVNDLKKVEVETGGTKYTQLLDGFISRNDWIMSLAKQQVAALAANKDELMEGLDDLGPDAEAEEPSEAEAEAQTAEA